MSDDFERPKTFISFSDPESDFNSPWLESVATSDPVAGQSIQDYKILEKVGEGAMAIVYKARQTSTGRIVAIKTLRYVEQDLAERFAREVSIHSKLKHKNIVEAIDCIQTQGRTYFVMEHLNGPSLEDQLVNNGRCNSPNSIADILSQICDALDYAHRKGVIHRDVKPENIILLDDGYSKTIKVLDFGVAKIQEDLQRLTKTGVVLGSPAYMSPEQCMGMDLDPRSDLYSLGVVAFELVTGNLPFDAETAVEMMEAHCDPDIKPLPIRSFRTDLAATEELQAVFDHVLQTDPDKRPSTIDEFKQELNFWWLAATNAQAGAVSPFKISAEPAQPFQKKADSVLKTRDVRSLETLAGRRSTEAKESGLIPRSAQLPLLIGVIVLVLVGMTVGLATVVLSVLDKEQQAQAPQPVEPQQTAPQK